MALDYDSIRTDNERRYGTDISRIGPMLLANRYADRAHFIFELLQNGEDALARRQDWQGSRAVSFTLSSEALRVSHFGKLFDEPDVRGICGIAESTKGLTSIGRFGIGFKSVYSFTDRPEVHSGAEHFAIESFVWPTAIPAIGQQADETTFVIPFRENDAAAHSEIVAGLEHLGSRSLLFLRQIEEITWSVDGGSSGRYLCRKSEEIAQNVRRIILIGQQHGKPDVTREAYLVLSRVVNTREGILVGYVEIAFALDQNEGPLSWAVRAIHDSPLVVFFPTILPTNLGFFLQGPYRTTPSRDNVPQNDPWNQHLVRETAELLVEAPHTLRDQDLLGTSALTSLPLDHERFAEGTMFAPLFNAVRDALASERLLPDYGGGHIPASEAKLARSQELRELFSPRQLRNLFDDDGDLNWLTADITQDRTPALRQYLLYELDVAEVTPDSILPRLSKSFLEAQTDEWIVKLYEFLLGQPALVRQRRLDDLPLVRLEDGSQLAVTVSGQPQAFLPGPIKTGFPTVRREVCATDEARRFLQSLGLTEPDPVDDVIRNILPRYQEEDIDEEINDIEYFLGDPDTDAKAQPENLVVDVTDEQYEADIQRILTAFTTDSKAQREKLVTALQKSWFVRAIDCGDGSQWWSQPKEVYVATQRLKELFSGVTEVLLIDDSYPCLQGEDIRELLEACGATRYLQPVRAENQFTWEELRKMRIAGGCESSSGSGDHRIEDYSLRGLAKVLELLPELPMDDALRKAA